MITVYFGSVSKRKNSTYQPTLTHSESCALKDGCSRETPTFLLNASDFDYNYCKWGSDYYFVEDVVYRRNDLIEVTCALDVLATYKANILASTQFVSYSSVHGNAWLADTRLPVLKSTVVSKASVAPDFFHTAGHYILSAIGENGCTLYSCTTADIRDLLAQVNDGSNQELSNYFSNAGFVDEGIEQCMEALAKVITQTDMLGNAFSNAPSCIRSCIWVPLKIQDHIDTGEIYLGKFNTHVTATIIDGTPRTGTLSVPIRWHFSDWRRGYCEDVYLYLPLVGMVSLSSDSLTHASAITVNYSYTLTDGCISYQVVSGDEIIGTYGGSCATNYPLGINQQASAGEIMNSLISGASKTASSGIFGIVPNASTVVEGIAAGYNTADTALSTHPSCIGGIGGGSGAGLDRNVTCYTVAHDTVIEPGTMQATMGVPTMKPLQLSSCSGYCQCANASVSAPAHGAQIAKINAYLNSGFFIE